MDAEIKKCPSCSQFYHIKPLLENQNSSPNLPLILSCGHSMCKTCVSNVVKFAGPIECRVCHQDMQVSPEDLELFMQNKIPLYKLFPVNIHMVGEIALQSIETNNQNQNEVKNDCFLNIKELMKTNDGECVECHNHTSLMCAQCDIIVCKDCYNKSHETYVFFKRHALRAIGNKKKSDCKTHLNQQLDYYCKDCSKPICFNCFMLGGDMSCRDHSIVSIQDMNTHFYNELAKIFPKVDEVFRRLTNTVVDIGNSLTKLGDKTNTTVYSTLMNKIDTQFYKLYCITQQQNDDITQQVLKMKISEIDSLIKAKNDVAVNIKKASTTLNSIESLELDKLQETDLPSLLEEAKAVVNAPWCLKQQEISQYVDVIVKEDVCTSLSGYIQLKVKENLEYTLCNTDELIEANENIPAPPTSIVYPPELVKDDNKKVVESKSPTQQPNQIVEDDNKKVVESKSPTQQPNQIVEGSKLLIYISHIVDPHNFYGHRASQRDLVQDLTRQFENAASYERPSEAHVLEGAIYLVYNKVDNSWPRCRIVSIDRSDANTIYHVFYIDFGNSDAVKIDNLRNIPSAAMHSPPPLAINCSLADCEPIHGSWTISDSVLIQNMIGNKRAAIYIKCVRYMSTGGVRLECDVIAFDDEWQSCVAHALAFHSRARIPVHKLCHKIIGVWEKPQLFIGIHHFEKHSIKEVFITHIVSPGHFFVREAYLQPKYEDLCENLEHEYSLSDKTGSIYLPEKSVACIANIERCGLGARWARAVVVDLPGKQRVRVLLADIGAEVLLHWSALRRIHKKYTKQHGYAHECHLAGVTPLCEKWSPASVEFLKSFQNRLLKMHVEHSRNCNSLPITLYDNRDKSKVICINEQMIKNDLAINLGLFMFNKKTEELDTNKPACTKACTDVPHVQKHVPKPKPKKQVTILENQRTETQIPNNEYVEAINRGSLRLEAKILNYESPSLMYVTLVHQQEVFINLYDNIQKYYFKREKQGRRIDWKVGDRCCTICKQSQTWRRAVILKLENENAKVFYSDFALIETVSVSSLRKITEELAAIGDAAIMCHLHGVIPAEGEEWPSTTKEVLRELLDPYNRFFITIVDNDQGKSMPIKLWMYHIIEWRSLDPNIFEWRCLNDMIIERGFGILNKQGNVTGSRRVEELPFLNITGLVQDSDEMENASALVEYDTSNEQSQTSNVVFISDWLPTEPLRTNEFTAIPTHVDDDGVIYLHDITQRDTLDVIDKALDVRFSNPDPKLNSVSWSVGEPCIALFFVDDRFYRGKVVKVINDTSTCLIHYIDFGNEELCPFKNLRKSIVLHQIPTQAHKCILSRILPVNNDWDTKTLDYVHKTIVEKECRVKVCGPSVGGLIPIEITVNNLCINDHLVDIDVAMDADGTKAIVRKFAPPVKEAQKLEESFVTGSELACIEECDEGVIDPPTASVSSYDDKDRVPITDEEETRTGICMFYPPHTKRKFKCCICVLNEFEKLELSIAHDEETTKAYENMLKELHTEIESMPALNGIYSNKACVALFSSDDEWYRASIIEYSEANKRIKVKYIDYGNIEVIGLANVKEISEKYTKLPPSTMTVTLHGVKVNRDIEKKKLIEHYKGIFLDKGTFYAEVIDDTNIFPTVELRNRNGQLIYQSLIEQNVLLKCD